MRNHHHHTRHTRQEIPAWILRDSLFTAQQEGDYRLASRLRRLLRRSGGSF